MNYFSNSLLYVLILSSLIIAGCNIAAGSYPYAEHYEVNTTEDSLITAVNRFKKDNPEYSLPDSMKINDGRNEKDKYDLWYHVYFYYPKENQVLNTWLRPKDNGKTTFAFVAINEGFELGNWKDINKDFSRSENYSEKEKFQERILNKVKAYLK